MKCPVCNGPLIEGEEHLHIGQIRADSTTWTGRSPRPWHQHRTSRRLWAKVYVWARYRVIGGLCRAAGGHRWGWVTNRCESCGLGHEWIEDWGEKPKLSAFLRCGAVVL